MALSDKHIFALHIPHFWKDLSKINSVVKIINQEVIHRLVKILRIEIDQQFVFFDEFYHGMIEIVAFSKKDIAVKILSFEKNSKDSSEIIFLLPLLKKEALEEAVYSLAEIGVSHIQLVVTQKSRQKLLHEKELQRLEAIVIAAAEQSKNYIYPKILTPIHLSNLKFEDQDLKVVFDPQGESFFDLRAKNLPKTRTYLLIGPEAGLTLEELQEVENLAFKKCRLTSTILRAVQAVPLAAALFKI